MTNNFDQFPITEEGSADFEKTFTDNYLLLLNEHKNAISLYKALIELVIVYFAKSYNENEVMSKSAEFLSQHFLQSTQEIKEKAELSIEQKCFECEVMILVELFILQSRPCPLSQTNIIKKFRFIYWNCGNKTREFLDSTVCEQFLKNIPLYLTQIYEELDFDIPIELKKYESLENQITEEPSEALINLNKEVKEKCKMLLEAVKPESSNTSSSSRSSITRERTKKELRRSPRKSRPPLSYSPIKTNPKPRVKHDTPNKGEESNGGKKRKLYIAETPEEKLVKKKKADEMNGENEIVEQTPFEKLKKTSKAKEKDSKKLTELLKQSEAAKQRASKRLSFLPTNGCSQKSSTSQSCINPSQSSSIIKHSNSLASISRVSSTKSLSTLSTFSAPSLRSPSKPTSNGSSNVTTPTSTVPDHLNAALTLSPDIIQKYKRRMDFVRLTSKKADSTEIFYGRLAGRPNLFNELNEAAAAAAAVIEKPITRSTATTAAQKNRSGRKVEQDTNAVYIAHTLLNVHNETPLMPFKAPKDSPFKVRKLVRHATRADWKKLQKFIAKNHCDRSDSAST
jgi:hypothetical protein